MPGIKKFKMNNDNEFEESPLLAREHNSSMHSDDNFSGFQSDDDMGSNSKLHPERFDMTRFSERQEEEESSFRIVIYIIIVILIGVALAFGARFFITRQSDSTEDEQQTETPEETNSAVTITTTPISDDLADNAPWNDDLVDSPVTAVGSTEVAASNIEVNRFIYDRYESFARNIFSLRTADGGESDFPRVSVEYSDTSNTIKVIFPEDTIINEDLTEPIGINDVVTEVTYSAGDNSFLIVLSEESRYRVLTNNLDLIIDVRTIEMMDELDAAPEEEETPAPVEEPAEETPTPAPAQPTTGGGISLNNDFSKSKQTVSSNVTGNTIGHNEFYYGDSVEYFEFAWGSRNNVGNDFVPNSTAEMVKENGKVYIDVTISNLSTEAFDQYGITGTGLTNSGLDLSEANFVRIDKTSFSNGTAKYRIELKREADFRLLSEPTVGGATQALSIQIKDI